MIFDRAVIVFAGIMVLASLTLSSLHSPYWLLLTAFVGFNLIQVSFHRFLPGRLDLRPSGIVAREVLLRSAPLTWLDAREPRCAVRARISVRPA